jgi:hypothetical protein
MIEHLFPHLMARCGRKTRKTNEINAKKYWWWAREDSNRQPERYDWGYFSEDNDICVSGTTQAVAGSMATLPCGAGGGSPAVGSTLKLIHVLPLLPADTLLC